METYMNGKSIVFFSAMIFIQSFITANAQFTGYGNDQNYQSAFHLPRIDSLPPILDDMDESTKTAYSFIDSITRTLSFAELKALQMDSDLRTLQFLASINFEIKRYSPQLLKAYLVETGYLNIPNETYLSYPGSVYGGNWRALISRMNEIGEDKLFLLYADYFFKIHVDSVITGVDTTWRKPVDFLNVSSTITENLFGNKQPSNCKLEGYNEENYINDTLSINCLNFSYPKYWRTDVGFSGVIYGSWPRIINVSAGEEYYVFLNLVSFSEYEDLPTPINNFEQTGGLFKIENGNVQDPDNFWGLGPNPSESIFRNRIYQLIDEIQSWNEISNIKWDKDIHYKGININISSISYQNEIRIDYWLPVGMNVKVRVYDILGRKVKTIADGYKSAGSHSKYAVLSELPAGVYYIILVAGSEKKIAKFIVNR